MRRATLLAAAYFFDHVAGDPEWLPHPVRLMGRAIDLGEDTLRYPEQSEASAMLSGMILTTGLTAGAYWLTAEILRRAEQVSPALGASVELLLAWTCLAARSLQQEAASVADALGADDLPLARRRLSRIVGRDTASLDEQEICRALIETLAESASDGVIAPLFYMALGGVPLAMAYKAVNTMDSMIGHADARYLYFGKTAARLDDAANLIPARLTALLFAVASIPAGRGASETSIRIWNRDGYKHKSPNAGQPEAAIAGALRVRLGGGNTYAGEFLAAEVLGAEFQRPTLQHARRALRLTFAAGLIGVTGAVLFRVLVDRRRAR